MEQPLDWLPQKIDDAGCDITKPLPKRAPVSILKAFDDPDDHLNDTAEYFNDIPNAIHNGSEKEIKERREHLIAEPVKDLSDILKFKAQRVESLYNLLANLLKLCFQLLPIADDLFLKFGIGLPQMHKSCGKYRNNRNDDPYDWRHGSKSADHLSNHTGSVLHRRRKSHDALAKLGYSLHSDTDCRYRLSDDDQQRSKRRHKGQHLDDRLPLGITHAV